MSGTTPPDNWDEISRYLQLFYPQYFDDTNPAYVDPDTMMALCVIAEEARPWCLNTNLANIAQAWFVAYLISLRKETTTGQSVNTTAGPVISEREGDIQTTYADLTKTQANQLSKRPPSDPYDAWSRLYMRCATGAILTRFGDPVKSPTVIVNWAVPLAANVFRGVVYPLW